MLWVVSHPTPRFLLGEVKLVKASIEMPDNDAILSTSDRFADGSYPRKLVSSAIGMIEKRQAKWNHIQLIEMMIISGIPIASLCEDIRW